MLTLKTQLIARASVAACSGSTQFKQQQGALQLKQLWNRHGIKFRSFRHLGPNPFPKYLQPKMCFKYIVKK